MATVDEASVLRILAKYLRERGCFEALSSLLLETNLGISDGLPGEFLYMQRLILQGRWSAVERLLKPIAEKFPVLAHRFTFLLLRQRFLETVCWLGNGSQRWIMPPWKPSRSLETQDDVDLDELISQINALKPLCSVQQFNSLCQFLSIEKIEDHPEYGSWTPSEGRIRCCEDIFLLLSTQLPAMFADPTDSRQCTLQTVVSLCVQHIQAFSATAASQRDLTALLSLVPEPGPAFSNPVTVLRRNPAPTLSSPPPPAVPPAHLPTPVLIAEPQAPRSSLTASFSSSAQGGSAADWRATVAWPQAGQAASFSSVEPVVDTQPADRATTAAAAAAPMSGGPVSAPTALSRPVSAHTPAAAKPAPVSWTVGMETEADSHGARPPPAALRRRLDGRDSHDKSRPDSAASSSSSSARPSTTPASSSSGGADRSSLPSSAAAAMPAQLTARSLFHLAGTPIRCAAVLSLPGETPCLALGSNNKSVIVLRYEDNDEDVFSSRSNSATSVPLSSEVKLEDVHKGSVYAMDWQPASQVLVTGSNDKHLRVCRPLSSQVGHALKGHTGTVRSVRFRSSQATGHDSWLVSAGAGDCRPRLWDIEREACVRVLSEHESTVHGLTWLSEYLVGSGCEGGRFLAHDVRSGQVAWQVDVDSHLLSPVYPTSTTASAPLSTRSLCALTTLLTGEIVLGAVGGYVTVLDAITRGVVFDAKVHAEDVRSLAVDSRGQLLAASYDSTATIWRFSSGMHGLHGQQVGVLRGGHGDKILSCLAVPQSAKVLTTGADGKALLWSL